MNPINIRRKISQFKHVETQGSFVETQGSFVEAIQDTDQEARTLNNMKARKNTANSCVDLFFKIGASRGKDIIPQFSNAFYEDKDIALRIAQWARDVRGGAGERELFRQILRFLEVNDRESLFKLIPKIPELGRWDDLLIFKKSPVAKLRAFELIKTALQNKNGLCAKWMPRKGQVAVELRHFLGWSPKRYRRTLVELTDVVEQFMCSNHWDDIDFEKVPSLAAARYKKAFNRHSVMFEEYTEKLIQGEAKVNVGAIYPYDVLKGVAEEDYYKLPEIAHVVAQWSALPNLIGDSSIFPMIDTSGSMGWTSVPNTDLTAMDVAVSLGLYIADKNIGVFRDAFLTFDSNPQIMVARGDIVQKVKQVSKAPWGGSTNIVAGFKRILETARNGNVLPVDMPEILVILSDMQFNQCVRYDDSAIQSIRREYENYGYNLPAIVFWNINAQENVPVKFNTHGIALVSGFSPTIVKTILSADFDKFSPENIMLSAIMIDRYTL